VCRGREGSAVSQRDREFLEVARLSISAAAAVLNVKPQAVSQGLQRDHDYLRGERLTKIFQHVIERDPSAAEKLIPYLPSGTATHEALKRVQPKVEDIQLRGLRQEHHVSSLWVFSPSPLELEGGQNLEDAKAEFFADPNFSIVYFVPPRVSLKLRGLLQGALLRLIEDQKPNPPRLAHIEVVECPAIDLVPHFAIANPLPTVDGLSPRGAVIIGEGRKEAALPEKTVQDIVNVLAANGIGVDPRHLIPPPAPERSTDWGGLQFRSVFRSQDLLESEAKETQHKTKRRR